MIREEAKMFMGLSFILHDMIKSSPKRDDLNISMKIDEKEIKVIGLRSDYGIPEIKIIDNEKIEYIFITPLDIVENVLLLLKELKVDKYEEKVLNYYTLKNTIIKMLNIEENVEHESICNLCYLLTNKTVDEYQQVNIY